MTTRAWGVIALVVTTTLALLAGMLTLGSYGVPDSSFPARDPSALSPRRGAQAPMIIAPPTIDLEPSSHAPLLIEIGPPEWVPRDSTLQVQGLPPSVNLSHGRRVSSKLWAVAIAALSEVRIDVAANAEAGQSDVTLSLVASDGSHIAEAHTAIAIDALAVADAKVAAGSPPRGPGATSIAARREGRGASGVADREAMPAAKGAAVVVQREAAMAPPEPAKPAAAAASEGAGIAAPKGGPKQAAKGDAPSVHPLLGEDIASQRTIKGAAAAPANKDVASALKGAPREVAVASSEAARPSMAVSEAAGPAAAKGGPATPAKGTAQSARSVDREEDAAQREVSAPVAPAEPVPASKGLAGVAQREPVAPPERAKSSTAASGTTGLVEPKGGQKPGPATPAGSDAYSAHGIGAGQSEGRGTVPAPKGAAAVAVVLPEPAEPSSTTANDAAGHFAPKDAGATSAKSNFPSAHRVESTEIAAQREVTSALAPSPQGPAAAVQHQPVVASEPMKPRVAASSEMSGTVKPNGGPTASARSDAPLAHPAEREVASQRGSAAPGDEKPLPLPENAAGLAGANASPPTPARSAPSGPVPAEENTAQRQGGGVAAAADKVPPSGKEPTAMAALEPVVASPEPAASEATGLAGARGKVTGQSEGRGASAAAAVPAPKGPAVVAEREARVASPEPAKPRPSSTATSEAGVAGVKAEPTKPADNDAQSLHAIRGEEIASQREIKSAFAAPVDANAARGNASRGDLREGEHYVARGEESLAAGNVAVARGFFLRAADAGAARGALLLASTYDPYELVGLHVVGVQPNIDLARRWYKRAEALGEKRAGERIARLERH